MFFVFGGGTVLLFFFSSLALDQRIRADLDKLNRRGKPNLIEVAANHSLLRPRNGPPRLLDLCLFQLLQEGQRPLREQVEGLVPLDHLVNQSRWPCLANTRAKVSFCVGICLPVHLPLAELLCYSPVRVRSRTGSILLDRERGGYTRRTKLAVTVFLRRDDIRLYVDLPFCPSDREEIYAILNRALNTPTFRPAFKRLTPGPIDVTLSLHVRHKERAVNLVRGPLHGCYFVRPCKFHLGDCGNPDLLSGRIKQLEGTFMEDAQTKIESHSPPPRLPPLRSLILRGRTVYFY